MSIEDQPIASMRWLAVEELHANGWNPNKQAPPENKLLKLSLLEDGWTQPVVAYAEDDGTYEIVDGYHRWMMASNDKQVRAMTDGQVPVVVLKADAAHRMMSTVRHNRARGTHHVLKMADLVAEISELGVDDAEMQKLLGMDSEEVRRLKERGQMTTRGGAEEFGTAWKPAPNVK